MHLSAGWRLGFEFEMDLKAACEGKTAQILRLLKFKVHRFIIPGDGSREAWFIRPIWFTANPSSQRWRYSPLALVRRVRARKQQKMEKYVGTSD